MVYSVCELLRADFTIGPNLEPPWQRLCFSFGPEVVTPAVSSYQKSPHPPKKNLENVGRSGGVKFLVGYGIRVELPDQLIPLGRCEDADRDHDNQPGGVLPSGR